MRKVVMGRVLAGVAVLCLMGAPAFAFPVGDSTTNAPAGVMFNVGAAVFPHVQVVGDFGYNRKDGGSFTTYTGGLRLMVPIDPTGRVTPFVEALAGGGHRNFGYGWTNATTFGAGAGVDLKAITSTGLRLQVNYFHTQKYGIAIQEVRFGVGVSVGNLLFRAAAGWAPSWLKQTGVPLL